MIISLTDTSENTNRPRIITLQRTRTNLEYTRYKETANLAVSFIVGSKASIYFQANFLNGSSSGVSATWLV